MQGLIDSSDFEAFISKETKNAREVLTIGETNMDFESAYPNLEDWRFKRLYEINKNIVGIDINSKNVSAVKKLKKYEYYEVNIESKTDIERSLKDKKFDLILMFGVIEHLSNIGLALENMRELLSQDGKIVITTNTPYYFRDIIKILLRKKPAIYYDHTCFIEEQQIRLLAKRTNLKVVVSDTLHFIELKGKFSKLIFKIMKRYNKLLLSTYLYIIKKEKKDKNTIYQTRAV